MWTSGTSDTLILVGLVVAITTVSGPVQGGSGFELRSQSATTLGSAQAGMTTGIDDVSAMFFNPAALSAGSGRILALDATGILTSGRFTSSTATTVVGTPITGSNGGDFGTQVLIPSFYGATDLAPGLRLGLSVNSLYGLGAFWRDGWVGRYYALNSQIVEQDITPTLSYRVTSRLAVGAGLDVQHMVLKVTNAVDLHTLDQVALNGAFGIPAGTDGASRIRTSGWGVGYVLGLLYEPVDGTHLGLSYRSPIHQHTEGQASFTLDPALGPALTGITGAFTPSRARATLDLPQSVSVGIRQDVGANWTLMADLQRMGWSSNRSLSASFDNPNQPPVLVPLNWHDSWFGAFGARYAFNSTLAVRFGAAYDQTPTRSAYRTPSIPDGDSIWNSVGLEYRPTPSLKLDVAYGHIFVTRGAVNLSATSPGSALQGNLTGAIRKGSVDYLASQASFHF